MFIIGIWSLGFGISHGAALDISRVGMGARSLALGRAQVAGLDLASVFVNPANAAGLDRFAMTSMYVNLNEDVGYGMVGLGFPVLEGNLGSVGVSFINASTGNIYTTDRDANGRTIVISNFEYSSKLGQISYGKEISRNISMGCALKLYSRSFDTIGGGQANGVDLDVGMLFFPRENLILGLTAQNLLPVEMANLNWATGAKEDIPINLRGGINLSPRKDIRILADYDSLGNMHTGVEWEVKQFLDLRAGAEIVPIGKASQVTNLSAGLGLKYRGFFFDYAYYYDTLVSDASSHFFSLSFLLPYREIEVPPIIMAKPEVIKTATPEVTATPTVEVQKKAMATKPVKKPAVKKAAKKPPAKKRSVAVKKKKLIWNWLKRR